MHETHSHYFPAVDEASTPGEGSTLFTGGTRFTEVGVVYEIGLFVKAVSNQRREFSNRSGGGRVTSKQTNGRFRYMTQHRVTGNRGHGSTENVSSPGERHGGGRALLSLFLYSGVPGIVFRLKLLLTKKTLRSPSTIVFLGTAPSAKSLRCEAVSYVSLPGFKVGKIAHSAGFPRQLPFHFDAGCFDVSFRQGFLHSLSLSLSRRVSLSSLAALYCARDFSRPLWLARHDS